MGLLKLLAQQVRLRPDAPALGREDEVWSYAGLWERAMSCAGWLAARTRPGDRVGLALGDGPDYAVGLLGTLAAGCVAVPLDGRLTRPLVSRRLDDCGAELVLTQLPAGPSGFQPQAVDPDGPAEILYTSGTTGEAKGVTLSHRNLAANCRSIVTALNLGPSDTALVGLPLQYAYGQSVLTTHLACGGRLVFPPRRLFWKDGLDVLEREGVTGLPGAPSLFRVLLTRTNFREQRLKALYCAGEALDEKTLGELVAVAPVWVMYGQTEATARLAVLPPDERRPGSVGRAIPGVELEVRDEKGGLVQAGEVGEVVARGDNVMLGYWNAPEETARVLAPWGLRTGDLGRRDAEGYLWLVGRRSDMIKSGGLRLAPAEIEAVLREAPGVREAAVVGGPDRLLGSVPVGFVVGTFRRDEVLGFLRERLPEAMVVRELHAVDRLPVTAAGKLDRRRLQEGLWS